MSGRPPIVLTPEARATAVAAALCGWNGHEQSNDNVAAYMPEVLRFVLAVTVLATLEQEAAMANAAAAQSRSSDRARPRKSRKMEH